MGGMNLKGPDSKNLRKKQAKTPMRGKPLGKPDYYL